MGFLATADERCDYCHVCHVTGNTHIHGWFALDFVFYSSGTLLAKFFVKLGLLHYISVAPLRFSVHRWLSGLDIPTPYPFQRRGKRDHQNSGTNKSIDSRYLVILVDLTVSSSSLSSAFTKRGLWRDKHRQSRANKQREWHRKAGECIGPPGECARKHVTQWQTT